MPIVPKHHQTSSDRVMVRTSKFSQIGLSTGSRVILERNTSGRERRSHYPSFRAWFVPKKSISAKMLVFCTLLSIIIGILFLCCRFSDSKYKVQFFQTYFWGSWNLQDLHWKRLTKHGKPSILTWKSPSWPKRFFFPGFRTYAREDTALHIV